MHTAQELDECVERLLDVLDEEAAHVRTTLRQLNLLRAAVIKRDEEGLRSLLDAVAAHGAQVRQVEMRRQRICEAIARITGASAQTVTLSRLAELVQGPLCQGIRTRQAELKELVEALRMEHTCTMILLRECSRLNRMLLKGILGRGTEAVTYTVRGSETWQTPNDMVNMRL